jgi:hypothetical protein
MVRITLVSADVRTQKPGFEIALAPNVDGMPITTRYSGRDSKYLHLSKRDTDATTWSDVPVSSFGEIHEKDRRHDTFSNHSTRDIPNASPDMTFLNQAPGTRVTQEKPGTYVHKENPGKDVVIYLIDTGFDWSVPVRCRIFLAWRFKANIPYRNWQISPRARLTLYSESPMDLEMTLKVVTLIKMFMELVSPPRVGAYTAGSECSDFAIKDHSNFEFLSGMAAK